MCLDFINFIHSLVSIWYFDWIKLLIWGHSNMGIANKSVFGPFSTFTIIFIQWCIFFWMQSVKLISSLFYLQLQPLTPSFICVSDSVYNFRHHFSSHIVYIDYSFIFARLTAVSFLLIYKYVLHSLNLHYLTSFCCLLSAISSCNFCVPSKHKKHYYSAATVAST